MASLLETLEQDLKAALKAQKAETLSTLRLVKAAMTNFMIEKKRDALTDNEVIDILQKQVKQRRESAESYIKGGRPELADKENREIEILEKYMPKPLSDSELHALVHEAIQTSQAKTKAELGKVMQVLMPKVRGRADGKRVNEVVLQNLS